MRFHNHPRIAALARDATRFHEGVEERPSSPSSLPPGTPAEEHTPLSLFDYIVADIPLPLPSLSHTSPLSPPFAYLPANFAWPPCPSIYHRPPAPHQRAHHQPDPLPDLDHAPLPPLLHRRDPLSRPMRLLPLTSSTLTDTTQADSIYLSAIYVLLLSLSSVYMYMPAACLFQLSLSPILYFYFTFILTRSLRVLSSSLYMGGHNNVFFCWALGCIRVYLFLLSSSFVTG